MMTVQRLLHQLIGLLLTIGLLANPATASSYVWCVSIDGDHAALEFAPTGDCSPAPCAPAAAAPAATGLDEDRHGCGPCLDISPAQRWELSRSRPDHELAAPQPPLLPAGTALSPPQPEVLLNPQRFYASAPRPPDALRHHRTTVLLI